MEAFYGKKYKLAESKNFDEYMRGLGITKEKKRIKKPQF